MYADANQYLAFSSIVIAGMEEVASTNLMPVLSDFIDTR
jgi:hypothetical protein